MITYDQLIQQLKKQQYAPFYLLCGEEPYYIDLATSYMEENLLDPMAREFDQLVIYGKDLPQADFSPVINHARGFAMMGGKKVVIVKEAQLVKKWESLALYIENPQPNTILIICYKYGQPDGRSGLWKSWEAKGGVRMQSDKLRDNQMPRWVQNYIEQQNKILNQKGDNVTIDPQITQLLVDHLGNDMIKVASAIQKLIDGRPPGVHKIDAALLERNIGINKDYNIFELQKALYTRDEVKAYRIGKYFAQSKDHPIQKESIVLYSFFANLLIYHYLPDKSNDRAVAQTLGINPFFVKDYATAAKNISAGKILSIIHYFRDIDARSKGYNNPVVDDEGLWQELIFKIMH